jgi:hypothetical protein
MKTIKVIYCILNWSDGYKNSIVFVSNRWNIDLRYTSNTYKIESIDQNAKHIRGIYKWFN